ncbi:MAG: penicillin-binding protein [Actinomycetota bacterium]|nr:penicillin-binding protein [Actinomycetota bacterium]
MRRLLLGLVLAALTLVGLGLLGLGLAYAMVPVPEVKAEALEQTTTVYFEDGKSEIGSFGTNRTIVPLASVPHHVRDAVLAAEDREFYSNRGVSPRGIGRAFLNNLWGEATQGGSTITQQYVKNAHLTQERTYSRKTQEIFIALKVDRQLPKEQILENYLNTIYWGRGAYGVSAAAEAYFGKRVEELTLSEGAYLAGIIQSPGRYDPRKNREGAERRWAYVLDGMVITGTLSPQVRARQQFPKVSKAAPRQRFDGPRGYLLTTVRDELEVRGFSEQEIDSAGLRVVTTFDKKAQEAAESAMREGFPEQKAEDVYAGLAAVRPGDGAVVAMYGGKDFVENNFNVATQAKKQPGSTFKAFTLAAALQEGVGLNTRWQGDSPIAVPPPDKPINNEAEVYGGEATDYGPVDLYEATAKSINTAFINLELSPQLGGPKAGPEAVVKAARAAGLSGDKALGLKAVPTATLGVASVSPIDMAAAYSTFAAEGKRSSWYTIASVRDGEGVQVYKAQKDLDEAFSRDVAADVTAALQAVVQNGTGRAAQALGRPAAGKTGTHEQQTAWFVGYTPQLSTAVAFYREADQKALPLNGVGGERRFFGSGYPTRIWTAFMRGALEGEPVKGFPSPADIGGAATPSASASSSTSGSPSSSLSPAPSSTPSVSVPPTPSRTVSSPTTPLPTRTTGAPRTSSPTRTATRSASPRVVSPRPTGLRPPGTGSGSPTFTPEGSTATTGPTARAATTASSTASSGARSTTSPSTSARSTTSPSAAP